MTETIVKSVRLPQVVWDAITAEAERRNMKPNRWIVAKLIQAIPTSSRDGLPDPRKLPSTGPQTK